MYPENLAQRELILRQALQAGFGGGLVVDYPHRYLNVPSWPKLFLVFTSLIDRTNINTCGNFAVLRKEKSSWSSHAVLFQPVLTMVIKRDARTMTIAKTKRMGW